MIYLLSILLATTQPTLPTDARYATVVSVHDGDTIEVVEQVDGEIFRKVSIRLRGVNCPELATPEGKVARDFTQARIKPQDQILLNQIGHDKFYRLDAVVWYHTKDGWVNLCDELVTAGQAKVMP